MQSERIELDDWQDSFEIIKEVAEQFEEKAKITGKDALRFSLLAEESIRLVSSIMTEKDPIEIWFEGNRRIAHICLRTETYIDENKREGLGTRMACWGRLVWATRMACWGRLVSDPEIAVPSSLSLLSIRSHGPGGALTVQQDHPSVLSSTRHCL